MSRATLAPQKEKNPGNKEISLEKELMLKDLMRRIEGRPCLFFASYAYQSVQTIQELRRNLKKSADHVFVAKNSLTRIALEKIGAREVLPSLEGTMLFVSSKSDSQIISKILAEFAKDKEGFKIKGAWLDGRLYPSSMVRQLATLPSRIELLAQAVRGMKGPITGFVLTLKGVLRSFVTILNAIKEERYK